MPTLTQISIVQKTFAVVGGAASSIETTAEGVRPSRHARRSAARSEHLGQAGLGDQHVCRRQAITAIAAPMLQGAAVHTAMVAEEIVIDSGGDC